MRRDQSIRQKEPRPRRREETVNSHLERRDMDFNMGDGRARRQVPSRHQPHFPGRLQYGGPALADARDWSMVQQTAGTPELFGCRIKSLAASPTALALLVPEPLAERVS